MASWFSWLRRAARLALMPLAAVALIASLVVTWRRWHEGDRIIVPEPTAELPGTPLGDGRSIGAGRAVENLTVFPIYAKEPRDVGEFTTLEKAIEQGQAEVRELGAVAPDGGAPAAPSDEPRVGSPEVGRLEIQNKGTIPIMVLAGTVVKGGRQDRQVGEDVVIAPAATVPVPVYCVEHGRWNVVRDGVATDGKFTVEKTLAVGRVRTAGEYEGNQAEVWNKVAEVNSANQKNAPSGTLLATLSDTDLGARREALMAAAARVLTEAEQPQRIVGLAYAVDGAVRGVRWFAGRKLFALHVESLLRTAALEALTAQAEAKAAGRQIHDAPAPASSAAALVDQMEHAEVAEKRKGEGQSKAYKKNTGGYASELVLEGSATPGAPKAPATSVTKDFFKK